jgi:hypothetical protein
MERQSFYEKLQTEVELHVVFYFQKFRNHSFKFKKILKKILDIDNNEIYKCAKSQYEILCIVDYTKITKFDRFYKKN